MTDKTQAVVVGADVVATFQGTGVKRTTATDAAGNFRFELMPVGTYTVKVTKTSFKTVSTSLELLVGRVATVSPVLEPGAVNEVVEVSGTAELVDVAKTAVGQSVTPSQIQNLPMMGRDVGNLALLAPGVRQADSYDPTKSRFAILSVNGMSGRNVNVTINGVDNKDSTVGGPVMQVPAESVQEFVVSTQRFSAANGRSEGAAINMVTMSGSNNIHGSLFGFFRDQTFNAKNAYEQDPGAEKSPYSRQWFGGRIGGPFKKDKAFGFFAYEKQREHTSLTESPSALAELQLATPLGAKPSATIPTPFYEMRLNGRGDYNFTPRETAYVSYTSQDNNGQNDQSDGFGDLTGGNNTTNHMQAANLTLTSVLSNTVVNVFTAGYQYWGNKIYSDISMPLFNFAGPEWFGTNGNVPQKSYQRKFQFRDDFTKTLTRHTLKFGFDSIWEPRLGGMFASNSTLNIVFNKDPSEIVLLPQKFATPGIVDSMSYSNGDPTDNVPGGTKQIGLYFQDDWKASKRLTLNLGLRWDKDINLIGQSSILASRTYIALKAINHPFTAKLPENKNLNFSPRVGFAYDLTGAGKHVLRGGFGLYYGNIFQNIPLFMQQQANATVYQGVFSITADSGDKVPGTSILLSNWRYGIDPMPVLPPPSTRLADGSTGRIMDPNYTNPYTEQFNVGYQWAMSSNSVIEAEYVHVLGLHENKTVNINPTINGVRPLTAALKAAGQPVLGRISSEQSINRSRYDGMNLSFRRRLANRYTFMANYTLSRAMGYSVNEWESGFRNYPHDPRNPMAPDNFGPTGNDERHHLTLTGTASLPWGFHLGPIMQFGTGRPYNITEGYDVLALGSGYERPVVVNNSAPTDYKAYAKSSLGSAARSCLAAGQCHVVSYNPVRGDAFFNLDMRISNNIKIHEKTNLELIFQTFNLTNHTNHGNNFDGSATSATFMQPVGFFAPTSSPGQMPRAFVGEFGFRLTF